jgi:hypothetical protein
VSPLVYFTPKWEFLNLVNKTRYFNVTIPSIFLEVPKFHNFTVKNAVKLLEVSINKIKIPLN